MTARQRARAQTRPPVETGEQITGGKGCNAGDARRGGVVAGRASLRMNGVGRRCRGRRSWSESGQRPMSLSQHNSGILKRPLLTFLLYNVVRAHLMAGEFEAALEKEFKRLLSSHQTESRCERKTLISRNPY